MRPILIGAGRGSRLKHRTDDVPKTMVEVMGRPMLDWILEALREGGFAPKDVVFIGGYRIDVLRAAHPEFTFVENRDWERNNILLSLMCAREHLRDGFVSSYTDIVYRGSCVRDVLAKQADKVLVGDSAWRKRYVARSEHPETDAEKMRCEGDRVVELSRRIESERASGEFIGVTKFSGDGARELFEAFDRAAAEFAGKPFREGRTFEKAYLIDLFQRMVEGGSDFRWVTTDGGYMELDTLQDLSMAEAWWRGDGA